MPKGDMPAKGYKMTRNRTAVLERLVEEGGSVRSQDGKATGLLLDMLATGVSQVSFNASLKEMENLGWISRHIANGRRTFEIAITNKGREVIGAEPAEKDRGLKIVRTAADVEAMGTSAAPAAAAAANVETDQTTAAVPSPSQLPAGPAADWDPDEAAARIAAANAVDTTPTPEQEWDWNTEKEALPGEIDYDILLGVFVKAALRGMEMPSASELEYYKQQNELAMDKIQKLEAQAASLRAEASSAIAERDQIQKNLNIIMAKLDKRPQRGGTSIRNMLSPSEQGMLDQLMKQVPTHRGD